MARALHFIQDGHNLSPFAAISKFANLLHSKWFHFIQLYDKNYYLVHDIQKRIRVNKYAMWQLQCG